MELTGAPLGGARFPCEAVLAGKSYAKFPIDVGCGDAVVGEPDRLTGEDLLAFAGVAPAHVLAIARPQQFAEKVHAYTYPWVDRPNTRSKDLVDLVLFMETGPLAPVEVRSALGNRGHSKNRIAAPPTGFVEAGGEDAYLLASAESSARCLLSGPPRPMPSHLLSLGERGNRGRS